MMLIFLLLFLTQTASDTDRIDQLIAQNELDEAAVLLEERVAVEPQTDDLLLLMNVYHQLMDPGAVQGVWHRYGAELESEGSAFYFAGTAAYRTGDISAAVELLSGAKAITTQKVPVLIALARIYDEKRDDNNALEAYQELVSLRPDNVQFRIMEGRFLMRTGEYENAIDVLSLVSREAPQYANVHYFLAQSLFAVEKYEEALTTAETGLEHFPEHTSLINISARLHYRLKQYRQALMRWKKIYESDDAELSTKRNIALCYYALSENERALEWFIKVLDAEPLDMNALFYAAVLYREQDDFQRSEQLLDLLIELQSDDFFRDSLIQRAITREKLEKFSGSIEDYRLVGLLQPEYGTSRYYKAVVLDHHLQNPSAAKETYNNFLEFDDADERLRDYARSRVRVLTRELFFRSEGGE